MDEGIKLFRQRFPLRKADEPAWGDILAAMNDVSDAFVDRPFGKFYDPNTYPVRLVMQKLRELGHSDAAQFWALDYLIDWRCLGFSTVSIDFPGKADSLPPEIREQIPGSDSDDLAFVSDVVSPSESFAQWPAIATAVDRERQGRRQEDEEDWVKAAGWGFAPGQFSYNGNMYELSGRQWELLRVLARRINRRWTVDELRDEVWDDPVIGISTIRGTISDLRKSLRRILDLPTGSNPIRSKDGAYWLHVPQDHG